MSQNKGLSNETIALMVVIALFFDVLQGLLNFIFMGWIITPLAYGVFALWFKLNGISFFSAKRAPILGVSFILELIPFIDTLPAITLVVLRVALDSRIKKISPKPGENQKAA